MGPSVAVAALPASSCPRPLIESPGEGLDKGFTGTTDELPRSRHVCTREAPCLTETKVPDSALARAFCNTSYMRNPPRRPPGYPVPPAPPPGSGHMGGRRTRHGRGRPVHATTGGPSSSRSPRCRCSSGPTSTAITPSSRAPTCWSGSTTRRERTRSTPPKWAMARPVGSTRRMEGSSATSPAYRAAATSASVHGESEASWRPPEPGTHRLHRNGNSDEYALGGTGPIRAFELVKVLVTITALFVAPSLLLAAIVVAVVTTVRRRSAVRQP